MGTAARPGVVRPLAWRAPVSHGPEAGSGYPRAGGQFCKHCICQWGGVIDVKPPSPRPGSPHATPPENEPQKPAATLLVEWRAALTPGPPTALPVGPRLPDSTPPAVPRINIPNAPREATKVTAVAPLELVQSPRIAQGGRSTLPSQEAVRQVTRTAYGLPAIRAPAAHGSGDTPLDDNTRVIRGTVSSRGVDAVLAS